MNRCGEALQELQEQRLGASRPDRLDHERRSNVLIRFGREEHGLGSLADIDLAQIEALVARVGETAVGEQVDQGIGAGKRALDPFGPMMLAAAAMTLFGALPASRAASAATSTGSPTRLTSAATAT